MADGELSFQKLALQNTPRGRDISGSYGAKWIASSQTGILIAETVTDAEKAVDAIHFLMSENIELDSGRTLKIDLFDDGGTYSRDILETSDLWELITRGALHAEHIAAEIYSNAAPVRMIKTVLALRPKELVIKDYTLRIRHMNGAAEEINNANFKGYLYIHPHVTEYHGTDIYKHYEE